MPIIVESSRSNSDLFTSVSGADAQVVASLEELKRLVEHVDPDVVVIDDALTPRQQRTLEDKLERRVLDRTAVILDPGGAQLTVSQFTPPEG